MSAPKVTFHPFNKWAAVALDGEPVGYMRHDLTADKTTLHPNKSAPFWLREVEKIGPWKTHGECQRDIKQAVPVVVL